jgi:branched-chain amino acid transport system ATP-binding protein
MIIRSVPRTPRQPTPPVNRGSPTAAPPSKTLLTLLQKGLTSRGSSLGAEAKGRGRAAGQDMDANITVLFPEMRTFMQRRGLYLSGGQKKMVAIARAMALVPSVLLLDEAFEGLTPVVVNRFAEVVKQIKAMRISVLIAESNLINAANVADRLYTIDRGEIIFAGDPKAAFANEEVMKTIRG